MKELLAEVLQSIKPKPEEKKKVMAEVQKFVRQLNKILGRKAKAVLGGSFAKDTWLTGDYDVDIFVRWNLKYKDENIGKLLGNLIKKFKPEVMHGSRDYYQLKNMVHYEIIPVLAIKKASEARNVTDFSYFHVQFVAKQSKKLKDDIMLFKQFCKAQRVYGAESYIKGFSGHMVDLLVIHYKGFRPLLRAITKWKPKVIVDMKKVHKGKALLIMNKSKTQGPLVFVDPVQPERNAAAAVSQESFDELKKAAQKFLKKPSKKFFEAQPFDYEKLAKKGHLIKIKAKAVKGMTDVSGAKLMKVHEHILKKLEDFEIKDTNWIWSTHTGNAEFYYVVKNKKLPSTYDFRGPSVKIKIAVKGFKKAHKKTFTRKGYVWTKRKRDAITPEAVIKTVLKEEKKRIKSARL